MPFVGFHELFPDLAIRETRSITVSPGANLDLPAGDYGFIEMYCDEVGCDCRRVFFSVVSSNCTELLAVIAWGWEDLAFYRRWLHEDDPQIVGELQGPVLNLCSPQSVHAGALLELTRKVLLTDPKYVDRIKRHYTLFREIVQKHAKRKQKKSSGK